MRSCSIHLTSFEVNQLNETVKNMILRFFSSQSNEGFWVPETGLNGLDVSFFVGHSAEPNMHVEIDKIDQHGYSLMCASRQIAGRFSRISSPPW